MLDFFVIWIEALCFFDVFRYFEESSNVPAVVSEIGNYVLFNKNRFKKVFASDLNILKLNYIVLVSVVSTLFILEDK